MIVKMHWPQEQFSTSALVHAKASAALSTMAFPSLVKDKSFTFTWSSWEGLKMPSSLQTKLGELLWSFIQFYNNDLPI